MPSDADIGPVLDAEIQALEERRQKYALEIQGLRAADKQVADEIEVLSRIRQRHGHGKPKASDRPSKNGKRVSGTHEIMAALAANPDGLASRVLADMIAPRITSKSEDKHGLVVSLIAQLRRKGKVVTVDGINKIAKAEK